MCDRATLKARAKDAMRTASPGIYLISLVYVIIANAEGIITSYPMTKQLLNAASEAEFTRILTTWINRQNGMLLTLATFLLGLFVALVQVGYNQYCLNLSRGKKEGGIEVQFQCFNRFWSFISLYLLIYIFTMLWSMLLVVPGIIAAYSYSQAYFILLDNPDISALEAIRRSKEMMRGYKMQLFVLQLSFIGWGILAGLTAGVLMIWLQPYMSLTTANFYNERIGCTYGTSGEEYRHGGETQEAPPEEWWNQ